jgi:hypothetical protein
MKAVIENATSEKGLIESVSTIKKEVDTLSAEIFRFRAKFGNIDLKSHIIYCLFRDNRAWDEVEKQVFHSIGVIPSELLFVIRTQYFYFNFGQRQYKSFPIVRQFIDKLYSFTSTDDLKDDRAATIATIKIPKIYSIDMLPPRKFKGYPVDVVFQSDDYIAFCIQSVNFLYVAKYSSTVST